ncbi:bifunctional enoyl-CoA hydratase/phosphate acetyltransferase [Clostridium sp. WLY-B-L2]|uniref:Bifunctional enoyl-CoA hydratase/phosphate acetyltransferase n=1 Tax=Clostridium aromativorans TaxID=2836848 RepID=A0ABS8N8X5_9CLOT|nr:bifunctional enoyl-CoA hydratase/phosphate acetyltransferase [Clostridium aromativorans]MCC9296265.1 bifunctional enoyl-CoA hydratase/phosphate acetyltransferase [Clostridium aromativorans]CAB1248387.1 Phosphate butyryltransferase [Clostridiaceae bacterium BL-3]
MIFKNFTELIKNVQGFQEKRRAAVVAAQDEHTLRVVFKAKRNNIVEPILIGDKVKIKKVLDNLKEKLDNSAIIDVENDNAAAEKAVEFIHQNKADFIMKGKIQTADILRAVVNKEKGLETGNVMSHFVFNEVPSYHKLMVTTDGGMMMYPNLDEKRQIIENAVNTLITMGYENPKVAVLAAVEKVNPKMPESVDAGLLKEMNKNGKIKNCIVEGPISYDLAVSKKSAELKGYNSPVAGDADILISPNITAGNILGKSLLCSAGAKMAGFIVGAKVPIVLTSRGSSAEEKYLSLVLSAAALK